MLVALDGEAVILLLTRTVVTGDTVTFYLTMRPATSELERLLAEEPDDYGGA